MAEPVRQPTTSPAPSAPSAPQTTPTQPPTSQAPPAQDNPLLATPTPGLDLTKSLFPLNKTAAK